MFQYFYYTILWTISRPKWAIRIIIQLYFDILTTKRPLPLIFINFCLCSVMYRLLASCRTTLQFCMAISLQMWKLRSPFVFSLKRFLPFRQPWTLTLPPLPIKSTFPPLSVLSSFITHFYKNAFQDTWCFILLPTLLLSFKSLK